MTWEQIGDTWTSVYPNLIAAGLQGAAMWLWGRRHVKRIHARFDLLHQHISTGEHPA